MGIVSYRLMRRKPPRVKSRVQACQYVYFAKLSMGDMRMKSVGAIHDGEVSCPVPCNVFEYLSFVCLVATTNCNIQVAFCVWKHVRPYPADAYICLILLTINNNRSTIGGSFCSLLITETEFSMTSVATQIALGCMYRMHHTLIVTQD